VNLPTQLPAIIVNADITRKCFTEEYVPEVNTQTNR